MERYKQKILIGKNVTGIMALPCVFSCYKEGGFGKLTYLLMEWDSDGNRIEAHQGDWLCEGYDGKWSVIKKDRDEKVKY